MVLNEAVYATSLRLLLLCVNCDCAVMGDQSSGKSSVLEALSGVPFPRGAGLVTRCATELRMTRVKDKSHWSAKVSLTWDRPQPDGAGDVSSPEDIGPRIEKLTETLLLARGNGATFEPEHSIRVELMSPDVPDLTVIDLPGIVRTAVTGQTGDVMGQVDTLLNRYLQLERTVVLAVIPVNVDIATADILERAQKVDPEGRRTIGVLTKPDLVDKGAEEEVMAVLHGHRKPLRLGYIMVKNRSQEQINAGLTLADAKTYEQQYFLGHAHFSQLDSTFFGVDNLASTLTSVLVGRIRDTLPQIRKEVQAKLKAVSQTLADHGKPPPPTPDECRMELNSLLNSVAGDLRNSVDGKYDSPVFMTHGVNVRTMARVRNGPWSELQDRIRELEPSCEEDGSWSIGVLKQRVRDMRGRELPGFPRHDVFKMFVKEYLKDWKDPAFSAIEDTGNILDEVFGIVVEHHVPQAQFPQLHFAITEALTSILQSRLEVAIKSSSGVQGLFEDESEPMTLNHYFMDTYNKIKMDKFEQAISKAQNARPIIDTHDEALNYMRDWYSKTHKIGNASNEEQEAENLQAMLAAYWKTSSKRFVDNACSRVDTIILRDLDRELANSPAVARLMGSDEALLSLFTEDSGVKDKRRHLEQRKSVLEDALKILVQHAV